MTRFNTPLLLTQLNKSYLNPLCWRKQKLNSNMFRRILILNSGNVNLCQNVIFKASFNSKSVGNSQETEKSKQFFRTLLYDPQGKMLFFNPNKYLIRQALVYSDRT